MKKTVVIDIVGLSKSCLGEETPFLLSKWQNLHTRPIPPVFPAVTTTAQSCYLTGRVPSEHGIVGNGWYDKKDCEIKFWKQANPLVEAEKIWEAARKKNPNFTVANLFWWYNMYSSVDFSVTPRPQYHADGVKMPDCYTQPAALRDELQQKLGTFPLFNFWGPQANIKSTQWIADASMEVDKKHNPTLTLIYLPHLDYCLQKFGPDKSLISKELGEIDAVVKQLYQYYEKQDAEIILLSEYGISPVHEALAVNRILRENGYIQIREENGKELLDAGASKAFAVADHQIAHIYAKEGTDLIALKNVFASKKQVAKVLDKEEQKAMGLAHERSGDLVLMATPTSWFSYYYWLDDKKAPDFARIVDIHRKPGYDPVEMFMNPANPLIKLRAAYKLARKKLGFRYLMDVIPLDDSLIRGSHGSSEVSEEYHPLLFSTRPIAPDFQRATDVYSHIWACIFDEKPTHLP